MGSVLEKGTKIDGKYNIRRSLGHGRYGHVYLATDRFGRKVAIKIIPQKHMDGFVAERFAFSRTTNWKSPFSRHNLGFPRLIAHTQYEGNRVLVMNRLGLSLEHYFSIEKQFSQKTVIMIGIQMVQILKELHEKRIVHRDVKPANILVGNGRRGSRKLYLIDFGVSVYLHLGEFQQSRTKFKPKGTFLFMPHDIKDCLYPSKHHDMESLCYTLWYLLGGAFPFKLKQTNSFSSNNSDMIHETMLLKDLLFLRVDCRGVRWLEKMFKTVFSTPSHCFPRYDKLDRILRKELKAQGHKLDNKFDWVISKKTK